MKKIHSIMIACIALMATHANGQNDVKPFAIIQGSVIKYTDDYDAIFGGSMSGGILLNNRWGLGANIQAMEWGSRKYYVPLNFEASYQSMHKTGPYFSIQVGNGIYKKREVYAIPNFTSVKTTTGGLFLSPTVGLLIPFFGQSKVLITGSYLRSQFIRKLSIEGDPAGAFKETFWLDGFKLGLGFKF